MDGQARTLHYALSSLLEEKGKGCIVSLITFVYT
jgi:hypothetical protein